MNDEYAESYLGLFYDRGIGISRNYEIAYQWYYKAANKGNAFSQYSIGVLYAEGNGLPKDYYKAFMWFQKVQKMNMQQHIISWGDVIIMG